MTVGEIGLYLITYNQNRSDVLIMIRKALSVILVIVMTAGVLSLPSVVQGSSAANTDAVMQEIKSTYKAIRKKRGASFSGYCGAFVAAQLNYMDIGYVHNGKGLNGNQWYGNLISNAVTKHGYKQVKYGGNNCLNDIVSAKGNEVYNVVISFKHQYGKTDKNPGYGHVVLLHAIIDGYVYFCECYGNKKASEGQPQKRTVNAFLSAYKSSYGTVLGAIHFCKDTDPTEVSFDKGGFSLNLSDNKTANLTATISGPYEHWLCEWDGNIIGVDKNQSGDRIDITVTAKKSGSSVLRVIVQDADERELARAEITIGVEQTLSTLDVNFLLDGIMSVYGCNGYATFDMYINGAIVADDVTDWCDVYPSGTSYEIKDIKPQNGCVFDGTVDRTYNGYYSAGLSGTFGDQPGFDVFLSFSGLTPTLEWSAYLNGHTYDFYSARRTWKGASEYAESLGGYLMTVTSEKEQQLINQYLTQKSADARLWLGATDDNNDGEWRWITNEPFEFANWSVGETHNNNGYLGASSGGYWSDLVGDPVDITGFIVEFEPLRIATAGLNGSEYVLYGINTSWQSANSFAGSVGGHLVTISSADENAVVNALAAEVSGSVWIGAIDKDHDRRWSWVTGETFDFDKWNAKEPNNANGVEYCVELDSTGGWNDVPDVYWNIGGFIVEFEPPCLYDGIYHHTWDEGAFTDADNSVKVYTCTACGMQKKEFAVTYDLQDGTGSVISQIKEQGVDLILRSDIPEKSGCTFVGWTSDLASLDVEYRPGDEYSRDAPVTLYAVYLLNDPKAFWGDVDGDGDVRPTDSKNILRSVAGKTILSPEQSILGDVDLSGDLTEDDARMVLSYYVRKIDVFPAEELAQITFTAPKKTVFHVNEDLDTAGMSITVTNKNNADVSYILTDGIAISGYDMTSPGIQTVTAMWMSKSFPFLITVVDAVYGDSNGDGVVNGRDLILLRRYLANFDDDTGTSTVEINPGADANGDGTVNGKDLILVRRYLANYDDETGTSTIKLGPAA